MPTVEGLKPRPDKENPGPTPLPGKKGSGRAFKTRSVFFVAFGSARKASGGFPSTRELNFHFCSRSRKRLQNGSQNEVFWAPKSELYSFWDTIWKKSVSFWRSQIEVHFGDPLPDPMSRGGGGGPRVTRVAQSPPAPKGKESHP